MLLARRGLIRSLGIVMAMPAVVRAESLMRVSVPKQEPWLICVGPAVVEYEIIYTNAAQNLRPFMCNDFAFYSAL